MKSLIRKYLIPCLIFSGIVLGGLWLAAVLKDLRPPSLPPMGEKGTTDTLYLPGEALVDTIYKRITKEPSLGERITTKVLTPDTVYVSVPPSDSGEGRGPRVDLPGQSEDGDLDWGIVWQRKTDRRMDIAAKNFDTGEVQRHIVTLPERDSDYTLRSGIRPAEVRASRRTGFRFGAEARASVRYRGDGSVGGDLELLGPLSYGTEDTRVTLGGIVNSDGEVGAGIMLRMQFSGGI